MSGPHNNLNAFFTELKNKGVKLSHQFQISFQLNGVGSVSDTLNDISMWAQGAQVPGRTQNIAPISYLGYEYNVPTNMAMTNTLTLTINADQNLSIRDAFLFWSGTVSDADVGGQSAGGGNKTVSSSMATLDLFNDKMTQITHTYELHGIFPTEIGTMDFSHADASIVTFDAIFQYQYWKTVRTPNSFLTV